MRSFPLVLLAIAVAFVCWGSYGPVLHHGQYDLGVPLRPSSLRPFICVGVAYFLIAVVVPLAYLATRGEKGSWTVLGAVWSVLAGAAGAAGALGIILAFKFRGDPVYVMPLVFGLAPVVNTFVTMGMNRNFRDANAVFYAGVAVVALGAAAVLFFRPAAKNVAVEETPAGEITVSVSESSRGAEHTQSWQVASLEELKTKPELKQAYALYQKKQPLSGVQKLLILAAICATALCWGSYGPVLHKGQMRMQGSRLRPFLCVGLAYFAIAVVAPLPLLQVFQEPGTWNVPGILWSLAGGAAGAIGALGIILAFNFGGKPIYVMPLVFGGAPVVNTLITMTEEATWGQISPIFFLGLGMVIAGAVTVLVFAPRSTGHAPAAAGQPGSGQIAPPSIAAAGHGDPPTGKPAAGNHQDLDSDKRGSGRVTSSTGDDGNAEDEEETIASDDTMNVQPRPRHL